MPNRTIGDRLTYGPAMNSMCPGSLAPSARCNLSLAPANPATSPVVERWKRYQQTARLQLPAAVVLSGAGPPRRRARMPGCCQSKPHASFEVADGEHLSGGTD